MSLHDMAKMTVVGTPGTGNITLGVAVSGFQTYAQAGVTNGEIVSYSVADVGNTWEVGHGTYNSSGPTQTRTVLFSSNANAPIAMTSAAVVACTLLAEDLKTIVAGGPFLNAGTVAPGGTIVGSATSLLASALLLGGGTGAVTSLGGLGTAATVLHGNASGAPTFGAVALTSDVSGRLPFANLATLAAGSLLGNSDTISATGSNIAIGTGITLNAGTLTAGSGSGSVTSVVAGAGLAGGTITTTGTISLATIAANTVMGNSGTVAAVAVGITIGSGLTLSAGTLTASGGSGTTTIIAGAGLAGGTITTSGTISLGTIAASTLLGNSSTVAAVPGAIVLGAGISLNSGTLSASGLWNAGSVTAIAADLSLMAGTLGMADIGTKSILGNSDFFTAKVSAIAVGSGLDMIGGVILATTTATVNSVVAGSGLSGGTINTSGTISLNLASVNNWTGAQRGAPVTLTSAATITPDFSAGNNFYLLLTQNGTLAFPTNVVAGQAGQIEIINGTTSAFTLAINSGYHQPGGVAITITATAAARDILSYYACVGASVIATSPLLKV